MSELFRIAAKYATQVESIANSLKQLVEQNKAVYEIKKDIEFAKWFIAIVSLVTMTATVVLRGIDNRHIISQQVREVYKEMQNDKTTATIPHP